MNRRPSRASKYHQQYLSFLRKWKNYVHNSQHQECEQLCLDHIDRIRRSIIFQSKQYSERHNGRTLDYNDSRFYDIKNYRSKVRNLYAVLLHDYLKQHSSALEQYELCVEDDAYNASAHYNWAILYKNYYKDYQSAEIHYRKAIDLKPTHAAYHNNYGLLLEQQLKKYESAREQFQMALDLDNNNGRAHTNMANLLKKHYTDYTTAQQHYEKAIALDPTNATRHFNYALFLKHNIKSFSHASNEYENALILEPQYFQAHNEYKNFLISESPFDRAVDLMNSKKQKKQMTDARHEHAYRCLRYSIHLLWQKKIRDARDIISMALKCEPDQPFAKLLNDPLSINTRNLTTNQKYKQLYHQKDNDLYDLQQKLNSYQHQIQSICMKLKQSSSMDTISIALDQLNDDMNTIPPHLSVDTDDALSTSPSIPLPNDAILPPYNRGPGSVDSYANNNRIRSRSKHQSHMQIPNGIGSNSRLTRKRHSLISVSSAAEYNVKVMDVHKQTLLSAAHTLGEVVKDMNSSGNSSYSNKMENVMHMILSTIRAWDLTNELDSQPMVGPHRLTAALIQAHSAGFSGYATPVLKDGGGLHPEDAYVAKTLGGMSMISQTSSAAMEQRRAFLTQAARNPHVREAEKGIAKWLTTYMRTKTDTPRSMLSQSQLPFFPENEVDEEEKSSEDDNESLKQTGVQNKIENCRSPTSKEFRVADRTLQWRNHAKIVQLLQNVNSWDFDVFSAVELAENYGMPVIFLSLCKQRHLITSLGINQTNICNYFYQISLEYKNNPFHNKIHGCDILVNCNYFLRAKIMANIPPLDQLACLMAGATHDVGHPGNTNDFEIEIESDLAIQYNDKSVYENFHVSLAWKVLKRAGCNVLHGLSGAERKTFRQMMIRSILATDMTNHAEQQELLAELIDVTTNTGIDLGVDHELGIDENHEFDDLRINTNTSNVGSSISRRASVVSLSNIPANSIYADPHKFATVVIPILVHTADLSNPTKSKMLYGQWADRVMEEFWSIGDKQRNFGLPVTAFMDREKTDKPSCQIGFINFVVRPWFDLWGRLCKDKDQGDIFSHNVNVNFQWMSDEMAKTKAKAVEEEKKQAIAEKRKSLIDEFSSSIDEDTVLIDYDAKAKTEEQSDSDGSCSSFDDDDDGTKHHRYSSNGRKRGSRSPSTKSHSRGSSNASSDSKRKIKTRKFPMISSDARHSYSIQAKFTPEMNALAMHSNKSSKSKLLTKQVSFVGMTFEDMNKVQMMKRIQIIEELKQRTREFGNGVIDEEEFDEQDYMDDDSPPPINAENVDFEYNEYGNHPSVYVSEHANATNNQRRSEKRASSARSNNKQRYFRTGDYESNVHLPSQTPYEYHRTISHDETVHSNVNNDVDANSHQYSASYSQSRQGQQLPQQRKIKRKISHKKGIVKKSHKRIAKERNPQPQVMGKIKNKNNNDINMPAILESSHESPSAASASQTSIL